jgi:NAD(P)-dependent dehydrogenase (short-subunit alcohol dehydrogenase family)
MTEGARSAVVVGVGAEAGLGGALCKRFARQGLHVFLAGRTPEKLQGVADAIARAGGQATPVPTDTTVEADVLRLFERAGASAPIDLVVFNAGNNRMANLLEMDATLFEEVWRVACFGGFLVGREAARRLVPQGHGTIVFTGATGSIRSRPPFIAFASAKAGLRAIAQGMAREFGPQGVHVAHVIIDGGIDGDLLHTHLPAFVAAKGEDGLLGLDAIADAYWHLHTQHRTAWTHELDLRPFKEPF